MINDDFSKCSKTEDVGRWYVTRFVEAVAKSLPNNTLILDAGAGECTYKRFFSHCQYKAIDLAVGESGWNYENLDYVGPLDKMPIEDNLFDAVLCTEVFEHLEWPRESAKEICRVLKPGGKLYLTVPMAHNEHQIPYDFFRYTSFGLQSIFQNAGFREVKIKPFGGIWVRWAYELPRSMSIFPSSGILSKKPSISGIALLPIKMVTLICVRILQVIFFWLDRFDLEKNDPFGWSCEAIK